MGYNGAIDVDINYRAPRVQILRTDYLPQHEIRQLSYDIDGRGIFLSPAWVPETLLFNQFVVNWYIFDGLEKWNFHTQLLKFSQKLVLLWVGLCGRCELLRKGWNGFGFTSLFFFFILRGRKLAVWKDLPRSQVDLLDLHSIGRACCLPSI